MFSNTGLAEFNMTKVTVALYYSGLQRSHRNTSCALLFGSISMLNLKIHNVHMHKHEIHGEQFLWINNPPQR